MGVLVYLGDGHVVRVGVLVGRTVVLVRVTVLYVVMVVAGVLMGVRGVAVGVLVCVELAHRKSFRRERREGVPLKRRS